MRRFLVVAVLGCIGSQVFAEEAKLKWTAPGDDGFAGRATAYEMRFANVTVAGSDTASWWATAAPVLMPLPSPAGRTDSVIVTISADRGYYFVMIAIDDAGNRSGYSNIAFQKPLADLMPPSSVRSLRVVPKQ